MTATVDILIPTYRRPAGLAVTLTSLLSQTYSDFRICISDQTEDSDIIASNEVQAALRVLRTHGHPVTIHKHLPRQGMAEHRQFLLEQATAPYCLFLDDDLILESDVVKRMLIAIQEESCGFVGSAVIGLSYVSDIRPHEQSIEFWDGPVQPEIVRSGSPQWERWRLHNAANIYHVQQQLGITPDNQRKYRVAWVGGCVMYDTAKLHDVGGYSFWQKLPTEHCGEDVLVQLRMMERYGGCGLIPSGVYHQELPTTIVNRLVAADRHRHADEDHQRIAQA
ncbi:MAG: glycosyltransferase family 2 protein, partial [Chroococcidiopsidaceae cyanobacterium CP_BM_RX_35]|nr:glycosyltransferase family 2 protein [Chroococcidiopsidaceae cyanobacterium CP_BM_RX_35]